MQRGTTEAQTAYFLERVSEGSVYICKRNMHADHVLVRNFVLPFCGNLGNCGLACIQYSEESWLVSC